MFHYFYGKQEEIADKLLACCSDKLTNAIRTLMLKPQKCTNNPCQCDFSISQCSLDFTETPQQQPGTGTLKVNFMLLISKNLLAKSENSLKFGITELTDAACLRAWLISSLISDRFLFRFSSSIFKGLSLSNKRLACASTSLTCFSAVNAVKT